MRLDGVRRSVAGAIVLGLLCVAGLVVWTAAGRSADTGAVYYYDLTSDELFTGGPGQRVHQEVVARCDGNRPARVCSP